MKLIDIENLIRKAQQLREESAAAYWAQREKYEKELGRIDHASGGSEAFKAKTIARGRFVRELLYIAYRTESVYRRQLLAAKSAAEERCAKAIRPDEARTAARLTTVVDFMFAQNIFGAAIEASVRETYGPEVAEAIHKPSAWFQNNPDAAKILPGQRTSLEQELESALVRWERVGLQIGC